jgi:predicted enzyme related to lactoylglutathione lyase
MTTSASLVTGVDFVAVSTGDLPVAMEFYATVLGLSRSSVYQRGGGRAMGAEFETGNLTLSVIDSAAMGLEHRTSLSPIALHVDDVAAARAQLESQGVSFGGDTIDSGVCHMAFFRDPDGNALMIHHRYKPRDAS